MGLSKFARHRCPHPPPNLPLEGGGEDPQRELRFAELRDPHEGRMNQNLKGRRIAIVVLTSTSWPRIQRALTAVVRVINGAIEGSYTEVEIP